MLFAPHAVIAAAQFTGALLFTLGLLSSFGLEARTLLACNLITGAFLLFTSLGAAWHGDLSFSPRLRHLLPKLSLLLVPVAFSGWADHAALLRSRPEVYAVAASCLPLAILLALQTASFLPAIAPTSSESSVPVPRRAPIFTHLILAFAFIFLILALPARALLASLDDAFHSHAGLLIPLLAAAYAFNGIHCALAPSLHLSRRGATLPVLGLAAAATNVGLNLLLIPLLGSLGAAAATMLTFLVLAAATYHYARQAFPADFERGRIAKIVAAAAIVYLAALQWPVTDSWAWLAADLAAVLVAFPVILGLAGFFRPGETAFLRGLLQRA